MKPDVIVTASTRLVLSFKAATDTVPVVGAMGDPVPSGIVANIARPGGNITGVSSEAGPEIWDKRLQILREVVPTASKVGFLGSLPYCGHRPCPLSIKRTGRVG
jgi:putative tryptophan/tyrosine transport system substrate-binding protein